MEGIIKKCSGPCGEIKSLELFGNSKRFKDGKHSRCKECLAYLERTRIARQTDEWKSRNTEYKKQYYIENKDKIKAKSKAYREANTESLKVYHRQYSRNNKGKINAIGAKRHAAKMQRNVGWSDNWKIEQFYIVARKLTKLYGVEFHVDHVIPLQGELVSGLHVETNLQIITAKENHIKSNSFTPEYS